MGIFALIFHSAAFVCIVPEAWRPLPLVSLGQHCVLLLAGLALRFAIFSFSLALTFFFPLCALALAVSGTRGATSGVDLGRKLLLIFQDSLLLLQQLFLLMFLLVGVRVACILFGI